LVEKKETVDMRFTIAYKEAEGDDMSTSLQEHALLTLCEGVPLPLTLDHRQMQDIIDALLLEMAQRTRNQAGKLGGAASIPTDRLVLRESWLGQQLLALLTYLETPSPSVEDAKRSRERLSAVLELLYGRPRLPREEIEAETPFANFVNEVRVKSTTMGETLTIAEARRLLKVTLPHVYDLIFMGVLWPLRVGKRSLLLKSEVEAVLYRREQRQGRNQDEQAE